MARNKKYKKKLLTNKHSILHTHTKPESVEDITLDLEIKSSDENKITLLEQSAPSISSKVMFWRPRYVEQSQWLQHIPFYFWLTEVLHPKVVVHPNIHTGVSYFAICQAIDKLNQDGLIYGSYGEHGDDVRINTYNHEHYQEFSSLTSKNEKQFLQEFRNQSIDLLVLSNDSILLSSKSEITSLHHYMSNNGIVLIHDSSFESKREIIKELKSRYTFFEWNQGSGLLMLCLGKNVPPRLGALITQSQELSGKRLIQNIYTRLGVACEDSWYRSSQEKKIKQLLEDMEVIKVQLINCQSEKDNYHSRIKEISTQLNETINEKNMFQQSFEQAKKQIIISEEKIEAFKVEKKLYEKDFQKQQDEITKLRSEVQELKNINLMLERDQEVATLKISKLTHAESSLQQSLNKRFDELAILTKLLHDKENQDKTHFTEIQPSPIEISTLNKSTLTDKIKDKFLTTKKNRAKIRQFKKNVELIQNSELFDEVWYSEQYPDAKNHPYGAAGHYLEKGFELRTNPSPLFNGNWYLQTNKDVYNVSMNPLFHYLKFGKKENRLFKRV